MISHSHSDPLHVYSLYISVMRLFVGQESMLYWTDKVLDNSVILLLAKLHFFTFCILILSLPAFWSRPSIFELVQLASKNLFNEIFEKVEVLVI